MNFCALPMNEFEVISGLNCFLQAVYNIMEQAVITVKAIKSLRLVNFILIKKFLSVKRKTAAASTSSFAIVFVPNHFSDKRYHIFRQNIREKLSSSISAANYF